MYLYRRYRIIQNTLMTLALNTAKELVAINSIACIGNGLTDGGYNSLLFHNVTTLCESHISYHTYHKRNSSGTSIL